ncbi:glycine betaine ABC transporter substrate-binding protein [Mycobacterium nebraskense]|uniref:ABC transporter n=2 Tax=Mycobacterium nebraskense TaxID=244292 RepID=A0A1X1ZSE1_9MYCO|nr:glycine betaine ABC transporter substrate-binding protein [Mycobacterium nebraskense]MBI2696518.1 ABC transporter [Mycobacterium nebraskense]MCV7117190.1 ABC transporter [Mycobacterium nebraskense]ORW26277.1 ABC transporter [Mycobacterium nebraskense]
MILAETLVFGSGPECPTELLCLPLLRARYGLTFKEFRVTDAGGPRTVDALETGAIQVGVLFTTDPRLFAGDFVLLEDDRHAQPAESVTPILRDELRVAHGAGLAATIDAVSAELTTERLAELNRRVLLGSSPAAAAEFLTERQLGPTPRAPRRNRPAIVVGSANFAESLTVAELYAHALAGAGFPVERRLGIGNRDTYFPLLRDGGVDLVPEYVGSLLAYLDGSRGGISDPHQAHAALAQALQGTGLVALQPAPAENKNGIVVTAATAARHGLTRISDLGRAVGGPDWGD